MTKDMFIEQAAGRAEADLRIDNAMVADVFSGEFFPSSVSVGQGRILGFSRLPAREMVDAGGHICCPALLTGMCISSRPCFARPVSLNWYCRAAQPP